MSTQTFDVYGIGNALVDTEFDVSDDFLAAMALGKGHMTLVEEADQERLLAELQDKQPRRSGGGSAANTLFAVRQFGGTGFYSCKVADDVTGKYFTEEMQKYGIGLPSNCMAPMGTSGKCLVLVTPDAERTMCTFLGISNSLAEEQLDLAALEASSHIYMEGYLASSETGSAAAVRARLAAEAAGIKTTLTLSDPSMVSFCRDGLTAMLGNGVSHLFCNEEEALTWAGTDRLDLALNELKDLCQACHITLGARGALVYDGHSRHEIAGQPVRAIDSNGAGDIFAGAVLYGISQGIDVVAATHLANHAAASLVQLHGARLPAEQYRKVRASAPTR